MSLFAVRIGAGLVALLGLALALHRRRALAAHLRAFFLEPSPPERIALVRVVLFGWLAWASATTRAVWWAAQPETLRALPPGWAWITSVVPVDEQSVAFAQVLAVGGSVCAMLGAATVVTAPLAALSAVFLLGTPSFFGKVLHLDHALVLMTLVLAASPCADALSVDRLWRARRGEALPAPSAAYTLPMRLCWLLLGTIYLFPGLWKVWDNGDLWLNGQRLLWELNDEWGQRAYLDPPARIDRYPWLLSLLGSATLVFEVGFFFALFERRARVLAAVAAWAFHTGVRLFLGIKFYAFLPLVMLIDQPWWTPRPGSGPARRTLWPAALVGSLLLLGQVYVAAARIETWPVALHPVFGERAGPGAVTRSHKVTWERAAGGAPRDVIEHLTRRGGGNAFRRTFVRFDKDVARGIPRQKTSRGIVDMLRANQLWLRPGDHVRLYRTRWDTFPIGERKGYTETLLRRYRVTEDLGLERVR